MASLSGHSFRMRFSITVLVLVSFVNAEPPATPRDSHTCDVKAQYLWEDEDSDEILLVQTQSEAHPPEKSDSSYTIDSGGGLRASKEGSAQKHEDHHSDDAVEPKALMRKHDSSQHGDVRHTIDSDGSIAKASIHKIGHTAEEPELTDRQRLVKQLIEEEDVDFRNEEAERQRIEGMVPDKWHHAAEGDALIEAAKASEKSREAKELLEQMFRDEELSESEPEFDPSALEGESLLEGVAGISQLDIALTKKRRRRRRKPAPPRRRTTTTTPKLSEEGIPTLWKGKAAGCNHGEEIWHGACYKQCSRFTTKGSKNNGGFTKRIAPNACAKESCLSENEEELGFKCYKKCSLLVSDGVYGLRTGPSVCAKADFSSSKTSSTYNKKATGTPPGPAYKIYHENPVGGGCSGYNVNSRGRCPQRPVQKR